MDQQMKTVFITSYALSDGIIKETSNPASTTSGYIAVAGYCNLMKLGRDVFYNYAEALVKSEKMRLNKIASLRKQIAKLEAFKFQQSELELKATDE